ncbi:putative cysteine peptidase, peptidase M15 family (SH3, Nlp/P60 domains) [Campylobacter iguaniorum]|uniref:bifunctional C40 family peptidase/M15 family metallopeptidase n=1 Tax=Campylobacter iguaniorum TaxID=1244531 RepID=UPI0007C9C450|nr:M15 family metallopeptidase [Campylobacter iguaniorum]ANE35622.1 putative cysteine peptidase, peptidase M15 family (SH3, Nlp/P60 domains) [Campylobacter iguaniorum]
MKTIFFIISVILMCGCSLKQQQQILDLGFEQNATILPKFEDNITINHNVLLSKYFSVWSEEITQNQSDLMWAFKTYKNSSKKTYYGESGLPRSQEWFKKQKQNANFDEFKTILQPALTLTNTVIRNFPTFDKLFLNVKQAGEGYPFDYLQDSIIPALSPVLISHYSKDKAFAFVRSDAIWGFVPTMNLKVLTKNEVSEFKNYKFGAFKFDNFPVLDQNNQFKFSSRIGGIFPYNDENKTHFVLKNQLIISKDFSSKFEELNDENIKIRLNNMLGQNYGWGGENGLRDCSLFLKDYFASFGIWLPRNSKEQGKIGQVINLSNLNNEEKEKMIKKYAIPFLTLLYMPGHIMLYAGEVNGSLVAVHDAWGIKTKDDGRAMIGGIAITDLQIGKDEPNIDKKALLLSKIESMNTIITDKKSAFEMAYNINIDGNTLKFEDGSQMSFDDNQTKNYDKYLNNPSIKDMLAYKYPLLEPLNSPLSDAGRFRNSEFFNKIYGMDKESVKANLTEIIWLKNSVNKKFKFNSKNGAAKALQKVSNELDILVQNEPKFKKYLDNPSGTFNYRIIAKTNRLSAHSWGIAIDINTNLSDYWQWSKDGKYKNQIPKEIVEIFEKHGFIWGGRWEHFDTMHFEYRPEFSVYTNSRQESFNLI